MLASRFVKSAESRSLWNYTLSPGWSEEEVDILTKCMMKHGVGNWSLYKKLGVLPGKTTAQLNTQTQRLLGQQATATFTGLYIDPHKVFVDNAAKQGSEYVRKAGVLINTGGKLTKDQVARLRASNVEKYGVSDQERQAIVIPKPNDASSLLAKIEAIQAHNYIINAQIETKKQSIDTHRQNIDAILRVLLNRGVNVDLWRTVSVDQPPDHDQLVSKGKEEVGGEIGGDGGDGGGDGGGDDDDFEDVVGAAAVVGPPLKKQKGLEE